MKGSKLMRSRKFLKYIGKKTSDYVTFSDKLICARVNYNGKGLTLKQAARKFEISEGYLCEMENGNRTDPSFIIFNRIKAGYNFAPGELEGTLELV